jgi:hypothetical protein
MLKGSELFQVGTNLHRGRRNFGLSFETQAARDLFGQPLIDVRKVGVPEA